MSDDIIDIGGVVFSAVRLVHPLPHWRYSVGGKEGPQDYRTRPAMWADLKRSAKLRGAAQWSIDWDKFSKESR